MGYVKAITEAITALFRWLIGRQDMANSPEMKQQRKAQQAQTTADEINRLTWEAANHPDRKRREAAQEALRRMDSE